MIPTLPTPPEPDEITIAWLTSPEGKRALSAYMKAVHAQSRMQAVVIKAGVRQPAVAITPGEPPILELKIPS